MSDDDTELLDPTAVSNADYDPKTHVVRALLAEYEKLPFREGLELTPARVAKAYDEWLGGYKINPGKLVTAFADGATIGSSELIIVSNIRWFSLCEHHMAPFFGVAHVGYLPTDKIIGLSKIARIVDAYARRLQVQERLANQVAETLQWGLNADAVGVVLHARHLCMESRGIRQPGTITTTSALRGTMKCDALRAEFYSLIPSSQGVVL